jgi:hypothetical protein
LANEMEHLSNPDARAQARLEADATQERML